MDALLYFPHNGPVTLTPKESGKIKSTKKSNHKEKKKKKSS